MESFYSNCSGYSNSNAYTANYSSENYGGINQPSFEPFSEYMPFQYQQQNSMLECQQQNLGNIVEQHQNLHLAPQYGFHNYNHFQPQSQFSNESNQSIHQINNEKVIFLQNFQYNQNAGYNADIALASTDFQPFNQDYIQKLDKFLPSPHTPCTFNYNNNIVDIDCKLQANSELSINSELTVDEKYQYQSNHLTNTSSSTALLNHHTDKTSTSIGSFCSESLPHNRTQHQNQRVLADKFGINPISPTSSGVSAICSDDHQQQNQQESSTYQTFRSSRAISVSNSGELPRAVQLLNTTTISIKLNGQGLLKLEASIPNNIAIIDLPINDGTKHTSSSSQKSMSNNDLCELFISQENGSKLISNEITNDAEDLNDENHSVSSFNDERDDERDFCSNSTQDIQEKNINSKQGSKSKKQRSAQFNNYGRSDIVFKTILRKVRKQYLTDFNEKTGYIKCKRNRKPQFLLDKLTEYAKLILSAQNSSMKVNTDIIGNFATSGLTLEQELIFFMGAIFYPKHLKKCYASNARKKSEIDEIHSSLYKFTVQRLGTLERYGAYHYLLQDFMTNHKDQILEQSKTMEKAKTDFILGFEQIQSRLNLKMQSFQ
eukprot:403351665